MSANFELRAVSRTEKGTNISRKLRREGQVPAVVYGAGKGSQKILLDSNEISKNLGVEAFHSAVISLNTDSGEEQVILREVQMHPFRSTVMHVDFQRVRATEKLHMKVPLHFEGSDGAPGVKIDGGVLSYLMKELDIKCLPKHLPEYIAVDVSNLGINESIHISQIHLPDGVELTINPEPGGDDPTIVTIVPPKIAVEGDDAADGEEIVSDGAPSEGGDGGVGSTDSTQSGD